MIMNVIIIVFSTTSLDKIHKYAQSLLISNLINEEKYIRASSFANTW